MSDGPAVLSPWVLLVALLVGGGLLLLAVWLGRRPR